MGTVQPILHYKYMYVPIAILHEPAGTCIPVASAFMLVQHAHIQWISLNQTPVDQTSRLLLPCHNLVQVVTR